MNTSRWGVEKFAAANIEVILLYLNARASPQLGEWILPALFRFLSKASLHVFHHESNEKKLRNTLSVLFCLSTPFGTCLLQRIGTLLYDQDQLWLKNIVLNIILFEC